MLFFSGEVDQRDWELSISQKQRNLDHLTGVVEKLRKVIKGAETHLQQLFPLLKSERYPNLPEKLTFMV